MRASPSRDSSLPLVRCQFLASGGRESEMSLGRRSYTNSLMIVPLPEPEGPAMRKICLRSPALAATRTSRRSSRTGRGLSKARPERSAMLLVKIPLPPRSPSSRCILDSFGRDCHDKHVQISPPLANKFAFAEACRGLGMIVSHTHKFIFLKTKKTAGTSIELALSELCGPADVITPLTEIDEAQRAGKRGAQNWRLHGWWDSPRFLWKRRWLKFTAEDYGFYNHM